MQGSGGASGARSGGVALLIGTAWALLGLVASSPLPAAAQTLGVVESEQLVRLVYFEGMPEEPARRIGPAGAARLAEMLSDPAESATHANVLLALGLCGQPGSFEAIRAWATQPRQGEQDRNTFRAWQALPIALAHAAEHDRRAVARLEALLHAEAPRWTFRHHRGARLHRLARRGAAMALGLTGLPEARRALDRAAVLSSDPEFEAHVDEARGLLRRRAGGAAQ